MCSKTSTPAAIAARRSASASGAGCTVAPSRNRTPRRNRGESQRPRRAAPSSPTASSSTPNARAAASARSTPASSVGPAVAESKDPAFQSGFGTLSVHEVKTDPRQGKDLAYFSFYDAGLRVASFGPGGLSEVGHYIAEGGNDFWGVFPVCAGQCALTGPDQGRGRHNAKRPLLLMSDRDSGLWILRYTGKE